MKKHSLIYLLAAGLIGLSSVALSSCSDDDEVGLNDVLSVKSVLPTKVMAGQEVTITGTGLQSVTAVVFPGEVEVTDFTIGGSGYLTVKTPAGIAAEGGEIYVKADGETATAAATLTVGKPVVTSVLPLDTEIKIDDILSVYGNDLEFIEKAIFPGVDGAEVIVEAVSFKRKSSEQLHIYAPMGIVSGPANVQLVDCSGAAHVLPEVLLSDVAPNAPVFDPTGIVIWSGPLEMSRGDWFEPNCTDFNFQGYAPKAGQQLKFVISGATEGSKFSYSSANWNDEVNRTLDENTTEVVITLSSGHVNDLMTGEPAFHVSGRNYVLERVVLMPAPLWEGEAYVEPNWGNWLYFVPENPADDEILMDLSNVDIKPGDTLRVYMAEHAAEITFCLCFGGGWIAPDLDGAGNNTIAVAPGVNYVDCYLTESYIEDLKSMIILGGSDWTVTKIGIIGQRME